MKRVAIFLIFIGLTLASCTNEKDSRRVLEEQGFTEITFTGYDAWGCGEGDTYSTGFIATSPSGQRVTGVVCGGWAKGYTVRFH
jgi:hypothetical protein